MKRVLILINDFKDKESNAYYISQCIKKSLIEKVEFSINFLEENFLYNFNNQIRDYNNVIFISSIKNNILNDFDRKFIEKIREENKRKSFLKEIKLSVILNENFDVFKESEPLNILLEDFRSACNKKNITWQKGIGVLVKDSLFEEGLEENYMEYEQLVIELEMFSQDILNNKRYHHNSFAVPKKSGKIFKIIKDKIKNKNIFK